MKKTHTYKSVEWLDFFNPTEAELQTAVGNTIDPEVIKDLSSPTARHNVSFHQTHAYVVLHFPAFKDSASEAAFELDFVVGRDFLITVHYAEIAVLNDFATSLSSSSLPEGTNDRDTVLFGLLRALIADFDAKLAKVDYWVRDLEKNMFAGQEKRTIFELSEASRHLIDFKKITAVYPDSLKELGENGQELFGAAFSAEVAHVLETFERARTKLDTLSEAVRELRETNASILSTKQNENMKYLTIITIIATIIVGISLSVLGYLALK